MISKELLSEVCNTDLTYMGKITLEDNSICLWDNRESSDIYMSWNIYELTHICKEWAIKKGYGISVHSSEISGYIVEINYGFDITDFHNISEPEAIFKACEWILKNDSNI
jgi:hypothetical protein